MKDEAVRLLACSIIQRAIADYVSYASQNKLPTNTEQFIRPYGSLRAELKDFFFSDYCDALLDACHLEFTGGEIWRMLVYDKDIYNKAKKMIYYCTVK